MSSATASSPAAVPAAAKSEFGLNNVFSGFIVAVIALPLCIAFAIASGASPLAGIVSGVVGGLIAAIAGSSKFQVSGPAAAFITLIFGIIAKDGFQVLLAATFFAGVVVIGIGLLRLGRVMELMPQPVIVGFTTGIGVLILLGQVPTALGVDASGHNIIAKLRDVVAHIDRANYNELIVVGITLAVAIIYNRFPYKRWVPTPLVALTAALFAALELEQLGAKVRTIGSLYDVSLSGVKVSADFFTEVLHHHHAEILLGGLTLGVLIAVESLLSSKGLDQMTRTTHNPDRELFGLGLANLAVPFLGGIPVSGVIVRGSANVMSGASGKMSAILHSIFLALFVVFLFGFIKMLPMAGLAAVLVLTAWRLIEVHEIRRIFSIDRNEGMLALLTVLLTVTVDLTVSVPLGLGVMILLALKRMLKEKIVSVQERTDDVHACNVRGSVNFLTAPSLRKDMVHYAKDSRIRVFDLTAMHYLDATGAMMLADIVKCHAHTSLWIARHEHFEKLRHAGVDPRRMRVVGNQVLHLPKLFRELAGV